VLIKHSIIIGIVLSVLLVGVFVPTTAGDYAGIWWFIGDFALNAQDIIFRKWGEAVGSGVVLLSAPILYKFFFPSSSQYVWGSSLMWLLALITFVLTSCIFMFVLV